jgi:hypothetical protein
MRKIINSTYITLDGVVEEPQNWHWSRPADPRTDTVQIDDRGLRPARAS